MIDAHYIFIVQKKHLEQYNVSYMLNLIAPGCDIVEIDGMTDGAARTTLLARHLIDSDRQLVIANSDQYIEWDSSAFMYAMQSDGVDGGILTFNSVHPKWSYARVDDNGWITEVVEKMPISSHATCGIYYVKRGSDYVKYAQQMIDKNIRYNGEVYVAPSFTEAINDGKKIKAWPVSRMVGLGDPESLNEYLVSGAARPT
jgi:dTDP-glucose pyrophosphorylase